MSKYKEEESYPNFKLEIFKSIIKNKYNNLLI